MLIVIFLFSAARCCESLSEFPELDDDDKHRHLKSALIRYMSSYYLTILRRSGNSCIYDESGVDTGPEAASESDDDPDELETGPAGCTCEENCSHTGTRWGLIERERILHSDSCGFDTITAITQRALNHDFRTKWEAARRACDLLKPGQNTWDDVAVQNETCLSDYSIADDDGGKVFSASFGAPRIQLVCEGKSRKAILFLQLKDGVLKPLEGSAQGQQG